MVKKKVTISLDVKTYDEFRKYCDDNAILLSKKMELWITDFMEKAKKEGKHG